MKDKRWDLIAETGAGNVHREKERENLLTINSRSGKSVKQTIDQ
jgi:hypothetical protein